ncbi:hypothetical protein FA13DRAFT_1306964 [Coprinellus micaceus]|uniref:Uncharacterized protein n=1 Tax=Coprinellus micaceus TaxID=71717 RepID=A0A4Y7SRU7_COPMI|nr:hypothetical protein FA13DRAFT_1306964 [Coprinellus micaceus]
MCKTPPFERWRRSLRHRFWCKTRPGCECAACVFLLLLLGCRRPTSGSKGVRSVYRLRYDSTAMKRCLQISANIPPTYIQRRFYSVSIRTS